jgi:hopanoid biosynthesis associated protein HpnK
MENIQLIVNGDDFGMSEEVNHAIVRAFREGMLTSCSLMTSGSAFEHAVGLARDTEGLAVGIHLVTVHGKSVLPHRDIPAIVDRENNFPVDPVRAGLKYYFSRNARQQLRRELAAQFEKFESTGLEISHIDSHLHMHVHPVIFGTLVRLGKQYHVKRVRVPRDDLRVSFSFGRQRWFKQLVDGLVFKLLCDRMGKKLRMEGFKFADRVYGHFQSGRMSEEYVLHVLNHLHAGVGEIYFHPASYDDTRVLTASELQCLREFNILVSGGVKERLDRLGIRLTTYRGLET